MKIPSPPIIPPNLIDHLDVVFPDKCPRMTATDREIWAEVGARKVVDHIKTIVERQSRGDRSIPKVL